MDDKVILQDFHYALVGFGLYPQKITGSLLDIDAPGQQTFLVNYISNGLPQKPASLFAPVVDDVQARRRNSRLAGPHKLAKAVGIHGRAGQPIHHAEVVVIDTIERGWAKGIPKILFTLSHFPGYTTPKKPPDFMDYDATIIANFHLGSLVTGVLDLAEYIYAPPIPASTRLPAPPPRAVGSNFEVSSPRNALATLAALRIR